MFIVRGDYVIIASVVMGAIRWIWGIIDVFSHQNIASQRKNSGLY
jgi:hypothetical protein